MARDYDNLVEDNLYNIPYVTGNFTFADWASHYNTTAINKLNYLKIYDGVSGDGIAFTLGTTAPNDPVGGITTGSDLSAGIMRCDISGIIAKGVTFQGDVSIDGTLNYDLTSLELQKITKRVHPTLGFTGCIGFTFGNPIRIGCTGSEIYYLGKADDK